MILLIFDSCGQEELKFYELLEDTEVAELAKLCDGKLINAVNDESVDENLNLLSCKLESFSGELGPAPHGPYSAIYTSGFIS